MTSFYRRLVCRRFIDVWFVVVSSTFSLSSFYRRGIVYRLVVVFYLCGSDSDKEDIFDSKMSNYVVNMLKIFYYAINPNIILSCIVSWMY